MTIKKPEDFQDSWMAKERGRVDVVQVEASYAPNKDQALKFQQFFLSSDDPATNALKIIENLLTRPKAKTLFVACTSEQLHDAWRFLCDNTGLDARFGTIGYNAQGITFYK